MANNKTVKEEVIKNKIEESDESLPLEARVRIDSRKLANYYNSEEKKEISVSPMYQPYFGKRMQVIINGISVIVPVDGSTISVPKTFYNEINARMRAIDKIKQKGDAGTIGEGFIGEAKLF